MLASTSDLREPQLREALDRLTNAGLLFVRGTTPESSYIFKHALVQDAAYGTLLRSRRQLLHSRIVTALEDRFPAMPTAEPARLAQHCTEAGLPDKAAGYCLKAGQQALNRSAMMEAAAQLRMGLGVLAGLPDSLPRQQQKLEMQIALTGALVATKGWGAALLEETHPDTHVLAEQTYPEWVQWRQCMLHFTRTEYRLALPIAEQLEQVSEERNNATMQMVGRFAQGCIRFYLGEFVAARAILERCMGFADLAHRANLGRTVDHYAATLGILALTLACLGYIDQARSRMDEALAEARRLQHAHTLAEVLRVARGFDGLTRSPNEVHLEEALALATEHRFPVHLGWAQVSRGQSLIARGKAQEGLAFIKQGIAELRPTPNGTVRGMLNLLIPLAQAHALLGQSIEERNCLAEAAKFVETTDERVNEAELLHRVPGDLLNAVGDQSGAEQKYCQAIAVADQQSAKLFQLRASVSLARLWRDQGKRTEARELLGPIYHWFTEGFDAPDLKDAKALLGELA